MRRDRASQHLTKLLQAAQRLKALQCWPPEEGAGVRLAMIGDMDYWQFRRLTDAKHNPSPSAPFDAFGFDPTNAAFDAFGLDPTTPNHRDFLLALLASVHFDGSRGPGQPRKWDEDKLCQLLADIATIKQKHPDKKENELCGKLKENAPFKDRYRQYSAETIRRKLQDARNPEHNDALRYLLTEHKPDSLMNLEQWYELALENIAKRWRNPRR
jgi:hypothetical protein